MYCCRSCGLRHRGVKSKVDVQKLKDLIAKNVDLWRISDILGASYYILRRVMTENGIKYKKQPVKRSDGYWSYRSEKNHRKIIERFIGRKLLRTEVVHHIDGNKENNDIKNLCLLSNTAEHLKLHKQLESVALLLFKRGVIYFDYNEKTYKIT